MEYQELTDYYKNLETTRSTLKKTEIISKLLSRNREEAEDLVMLVSGRLFPKWKNKDLGLSSKTLVKIISRATGRSESEVKEHWKDSGDLGNAAMELSRNKTQTRLSTRKLTTDEVLDTLNQIAEMEQKSLDSVDVDKKIGKAADLVSTSKPEEAKYIVRNLLQNMRLGVGEGLIRDAITQAFLAEGDEEIVQRAYDLTNDFQRVCIAAKKGVKEVEELEMEIFKPVNSMLAKKVESIDEGFEEVGKPARVDFKYDGIRAQIHKKDGEVKVFTRRLEDITEQFPDVIKAVEDNVQNNVIIDTEIVGYRPEDGSTIPFQRLSKRVKRKYEIEKMEEKIPVVVKPFDVLYYGQNVMNKPLKERISILEDIVTEEGSSIEIVDSITTDDEKKVAEFDNKATSQGHEGIMMKSLDAAYKPGSRVGYMVKLKPVMETLDLAVIGAKWSEGRRSGWLGRLKLGCYNKEEDRHEMVGRMATGLTDDQLEEITNKLESRIVESKGREVKVKPDVILEVEYEEIQSSPNYESGFALRFPRLKSFREDKQQADSLEKVTGLYESQS